MPIYWDENPKITKKGASEYLETNAGLKKIRSWAPERAEWNLTKLGRRFFRGRPSEYLISIPVQYKIIRERDSATVQYKGYMPITQLSTALQEIIAEIMATEGEAPDLMQRLRRGILSEVTRWRDAENGDIAVHYESDAITYYSPSTPRAWKVSELRTTVEDDGGVIQQAFLDMPLGRAKPSSLIDIEGVCLGAFIDLKPGVNCAIYQLSHHLNLSYEDTETAFSVISQELYGDASITPRVLIHWCAHQQISCYYFAMNKKTCSTP